MIQPASTEIAGPVMRRRCPLCATDDTQAFWRKEGLTVVRCRRCSMVYANPVEEELASGKFYDRLSVPFYLSPDKLAGDYAPVRFERELRLFREFCPRGAVLDVGCSTGAFLYHLRQAGDYRVTGTDVASDALDHAARQGAEVIRAPFLDHDFGGRQFDAVTFWAVLEHLTRPADFLRQAADLLPAGGHCFVLVPNLGSLAVKVCGPKYRYIMPDHVNYFSAATLRSLAEQTAGFEVVALRSTHFNPMVIWKDLRGGLARVSDEDRVRLLKQTTALKQKPWLKPVKWLYRGVESLLGKAMLADNLVIVLRRR